MKNNNFKKKVLQMLQIVCIIPIDSNKIDQYLCIYMCKSTKINIWVL